MTAFSQRAEDEQRQGLEGVWETVTETEDSSPSGRGEKAGRKGVNEPERRTKNTAVGRLQAVKTFNIKPRKAESPVSDTRRKGVSTQLVCHRMPLCSLAKWTSGPDLGEVRRYRHTSLYCMLLYCASQVLRVVAEQLEGKRLHQQKEDSSLYRNTCLLQLPGTEPAGLRGVPELQCKTHAVSGCRSPKLLLSDYSIDSATAQSVQVCDT